MWNTSNPDIQHASTDGPCNVYESCTDGDHAMIYFDLETSGRSNYCHEILQIAAKYDNVTFNVYVTPTKNVSPEASIVNGMENRDGRLFVNGTEVHSVHLSVALKKFHEFLVSSGRCNILVAHNSPFDTRFLLHAFDETNSIELFSFRIHGIVNTLPLFRKIFPAYKNHTLENLVRSHLDVSQDNFHNGLYDVIVLQLLVEKFIPVDMLIQQCETYDRLVQKQRELEKIRFVEQTLQPLRKDISAGMIRRLAEFNLDYATLTHLYRCHGKDGVEDILWGGPTNNRIIKRKNILDSILAHLQETNEY